ncbi:MAG TPA: response regulator, partial [Longimicrobiales bacterium]
MARILVIEDDPHQRQLYTTLLYYNGFDTDEASSAEAGIAAARQNRPDAVLVDVRLPGMNGLQLANLLKQTPAT